MNTNSAFTGYFVVNLLHYREFWTQYFSGGTVVIVIDINNDFQAYFTSMEAIDLSDKVPNLHNYLFEDHHIIEFYPK